MISWPLEGIGLEGSNVQGREKMEFLKTLGIEKENAACPPA
jgi:hypothetical protein